STMLSILVCRILNEPATSSLLSNGNFDYRFLYREIVITFRHTRSGDPRRLTYRPLLRQVNRLSQPDQIANRSAHGLTPTIRRTPTYFVRHVIVAPAVSDLFYKRDLTTIAMRYNYPTARLEPVSNLLGDS